MALQDQVIPIPFGAGINTKVDPKALSGQTLQMQDGVFGVGNQVAKRNGYTKLLSQESLLTKSFGNQLILADGQKLYSYAADTEVLTTVGNHQSVSVNPTNIVIQNEKATNIRSVYLTSAAGSFVCTTYTQNVFGSSTSLSYLNIIDATTGLTLIPDTVIFSNPSAFGNAYVQPFVVGQSTPTPHFGFVYEDVNNNLHIGSVVAPFNSPSNIVAAIPLISHVYTFNVINSGGLTSYISYSTTSSPPEIQVSTLVGTTITGTVNTGTFGAGVYQRIQSVFDDAGNIWNGMMNSDGTNSYVGYSVVSPALATLKAATQVITYPSSAPIDPTTIALSPQTGLNVNLYYTRFFLFNAAFGVNGAGNLVETFVSSLTLTAFTTPITYLVNMEVETSFVKVMGGAGLSGGSFGVFASVPATIAGVTDVNSANSSLLGVQNTFYLVNESTKSAVAKCHAGTAIPVALDTLLNFNRSNAFITPNQLALQVIGPNVYFGAPYVERDVSEAVSSATLTTIASYGTTCEDFNFNDSQAYQVTNFQNTLVFNGGVLKGYDGDSLSEINFLQYPETQFITINSTGGDINGGASYGYACTYSWTDASNQIYESFAFITSVLIPPGSTNSITALIPTLGLSDKVTNTRGAPVYVNLYRTDANGTIFYFLDQTLNDPTVTFVEFIDGYGPTLAGQPELYTTGGVLDNDPPPPSMILTVRENRLYAADSENINTDYWFTKTAEKGSGINFSDFFVETIDSLGGPIMSQAQMDEKLVTFKATTLGYQVGDGPNDTGNPASSSLSNFQFVPTDTGCGNHRATIVIPDGTLFQSPKGIYLLGRGLNVVYYGPEVQTYNSQFITASTMIGNVNQVRFLTNAGTALVFNYYFKQWGTFSNHLATSADIWNGNYTYSRIDNTVYTENSTTFLDDTAPYSLLVQLSWLKFGGIQGFERIKQCFLLGDQTSPASGHGVTIAAAYNYDPTFDTSIGYLFQASSGVFQYREYLPRQKCEALTLLIQEMTTGASGEYIDFTDLSVLAGVKKGSFKLPALNSVG